MTQFLTKRLYQRQKLGNLRELKIETDLIDFSSNDYLGMARSPLFAASIAKEMKARDPLCGIGSTGSRLLTGNSTYVQELERTIATFHGYESGLLFNCGYMANSGLLSSIAQYGDQIFFDASIHASMREGIKLSSAEAFAFRHNDLNHLEKRLKMDRKRAERFICIESIYSTDGSIAPLQEICFLAERYGAHVIVDEAHAVGVWGPQGRGLVAENHLNSRVFALIATCGKALGCFGAIILGSSLLTQTLINYATSSIYTTALPFLCLYAIKCSYDRFPFLEAERAHVRRLIQLFQSANSFATQIQALSIPGALTVKHASNMLKEKGFDVRPLTSPTVQRGQEVLRICLHAHNTERQVHALLNHVRSQ